MPKEKLTVNKILKQKIVKLKLGSDKPAEGYLTVDPEDGPFVDLVGDITRLAFPNRSVDAIICRDIIQRFKYTEIKGVLKDWYRVLKYGGRIVIQCLDFGQIVDKYLNAKCECWDEYTRKAKADCAVCSGKAELNNMKLRSYIFGTYRKPNRTHHNIIDKRYLIDLMASVGFTIKSTDELPNRIRVIATKVRKS